MPSTKYRTLNCLDYKRMKIISMFIFLAMQDFSVAEKISHVHSCIPARPNIDGYVQRQKCHPYMTPNRYCKHFIQNATIFATKYQQMKRGIDMLVFSNIENILNRYHVTIRISCLETFRKVYCNWWFPKCDLTSSNVTGSPICREACEYFISSCKDELKKLSIFKGHSGLKGVPIIWDAASCRKFRYRNGGDNPECYYPRNLNSETDKLQGKECYYGNGLGYRGTVNVTRSGHVCQSWSSQCPHRHNHPLAEYPELINASNSCRNPGGQAPNGPWCYTTSTGTRWEYCNVRKCPAPGPSRSPDIVQAFSTGPNRISLEWRPVPLPFVHGTPRGFRILISKLFGKETIINTTSPDIKYFDIENLQPLTRYSLSVLEFNQHADGPWSQSVLVQTMPKNFVAVRLVIILENKGFDSRLLDRNSTQYKTLQSDILFKLKTVFKRSTTEDYNIYKIRIIRFFKGSLGVELDITAELLNSTSSSATQDIAQKIFTNSKTGTRNSRSLNFSSVIVKASPPPPVNLILSDITMTSVTVNWSMPVENQPFRITNYTVQYKKSGTNMLYYNAIIVDSDQRQSVVENMDSNTKYLMRVVSINAYGSQPSNVVSVKTKGKADPKTSILVFVIPSVVLAVLLIGVVCLFWKWFQKKKENETQLLLKARIERLRLDPYDSKVDWFELLKIEILKSWWEIARDNLTLEHELGSGAFGVVVKGFLKEGENDGERGQHCAVKKLKENPTERETRDFCNEINIMSSIGDHPNIVSLIGACTIDGPLLLVVRFAPNGCLLEYIKESRPLPEYEIIPHDSNDLPKAISEKEKLKFAYEIAQGMTHLEKHRYVHRDLAARNVLLGKNMVAMVSDFGLSRDVYSYQSGVYESINGGKLPLRWMSLESLQYNNFSTATDIWSYGVLLWEIESRGVLPYGGLSGPEILEKLKCGQRLEKPPGTSRDLYSIMRDCWHPDPYQRPRFSDLVYQVGGLLSLSGGDIEGNDGGPNYDNEAMQEEVHSLKTKEDTELRAIKT